MDKEQIFEKVKEMVIDTLQFDGDVTLDSSFADDLQADSLDVVELTMALEEQYGITIPDEELPNIKTVGDIVNYIDEHQDEAK
jgi:acyl carrier protein